MKGGNQDLINAIKDGNVDKVNQLLAAGADVNYEAKKGFTPLFVASYFGNIEVVKLLLAKGADVNKALPDGATALMVASQKGYAEVVKLLLVKGADVNQALTNGATALLMASENGHTEVVELLLAKGADVNQKMSDGSTPLFMASKNDHDEIVELLLKSDAEITEMVQRHMSSFTLEIRKLLNNDSTPLSSGCDAVFEDGIRFSWEPKFNLPYKDSLSCKLKTTDGRYVKVKIPYDYDMIVNYLNTLPKYNERTLENGLYTWLLYSQTDPSVVQFVAMRVKNAFEVGTIHKAIALAVGTNRIHGAGELLKTDTNITYNLTSGTFTYAWLDARKKKRTCTPEELDEKIDSEFVRRFSNYRLTRIYYSMIRTSIPVYESDLEEYKAAGFEVSVFESEESCKAFRGGKRRKTRRRRSNFS